MSIVTVTAAVRLTQPIPRRQGFEIGAVQAAVDETLRAHWPAAAGWVRWQVGGQPHRWYGDRALLQRLLAGLITAAARYNNIGGRPEPAIVVRADVYPDQWLGRIRVSVDGGCFFAGHAAASAGELLSDPTERTELRVWHHLAAALLTNPRIERDHSGGGWTIQFDLPLDSPLGVAKQWSRWRLQEQAAHADHQAADGGRSQAAATDWQHPYGWLETLLSGQIGASPRHAGQAVLLTVVAGAAVSADALDAFERRLEHEQSLHDLAYQISKRRWVLVWDNTVSEARERIEQLAASWLQATHPVRFRWSRIAPLPLCPGQTATLLSDRFSREHLGDRESGRLRWGQPDDELLAPSAIPTERLVAEIRHLSARVRAQNEHLGRQARELRLGSGSAAVS